MNASDSVESGDLAALRHEFCRIRAAIRDLQPSAHLIADDLDYEGPATDRAVELRHDLGELANTIRVPCCVLGEHEPLDYDATFSGFKDSRATSASRNERAAMWTRRNSSTGQFANVETSPSGRGQRTGAVTRRLGAEDAPSTAVVTPSPLIAAWAQHLDDTAAYAGGFTDPERDGIRAAARMMRDPNVQAQVAKTVGGES